MNRKKNIRNCLPQINFMFWSNRIYLILCFWLLFIISVGWLHLRPQSGSISTLSESLGLSYTTGELRNVLTTLLQQKQEIETQNRFYNKAYLIWGLSMRIVFLSVGVVFDRTMKFCVAEDSSRGLLWSFHFSREIHNISITVINFDTCVNFHRKSVWANNSC